MKWYQLTLREVVMLTVIVCMGATIVHQHLTIHALHKSLLTQHGPDTMEYLRKVNEELSRKVKSQPSPGKSGMIELSGR